MATNTSGGTTTSFSNTPQAKDDVLTNTGLTEETLGIRYLDVLGNDLGGGAKTLWSLDNACSPSTTTNGVTVTKIYAPADLLTKDTVYANTAAGEAAATAADLNLSLNGATIWITSDGKVGYDASSLSDAFKQDLQELGAGEKLTDKFTYAIRLGNGTLSWATAEVEFQGVNDGPTVDASDPVGMTEDLTASAQDLSDTGWVNFDDIDTNDVIDITYTSNNDIAWSDGTIDPGLAAQLVAGFSTGVIDADAPGSTPWTYGVTGADLDFLAAGETITFSYTVTATDSQGATATDTVSFTITGTNDAAILSSDTEELVESNAVLSTGGTLTISDVDSAETFVAQTDTAGTYGKFSVGTDGTWTYSTAPSAHDEFVDGATYTDTFSVFSADGTETSVTINITGTNDAAILSSDTEELVESNAVLSTGGTLTISDVDSAETFVAQTDTAGTYGKFSVGTDGTWTYSTAPSAHDEFVDGATYTDTFSVFSADGTETSVTINITGTNDAAILSSDTEELVESNAVLSTGGTLTISDVDSAETFVAQTDTAGTYGKFSVGTDGTWTYSTAPSAHDEFVDGATYTDTFSVFSADGTETSVTINITGTNDAAILSSDTEELVESNAVLSTGGTLTISDVDSAETFVAQTDTAGTYGKFSVGTDGTWTYSTAPSAHDEFVDGATYTDTFSVFSADGTETSVTINITGTNDAAILSSDTEELVESNAVLSTGGTLTISDVDSAETFVAQTDTAGTYGKFSVGTDGTWTYSTAPSAHDEFVDGATYTDTFSVFSADGTETSVTINITGTNDAAILSSDTEELVESNAVLSTGGTLTISDVDSAETFVAQTDTAGTYGKFSVGTDGTWTYSTAPSAHDEFVDGATYTDTFSVFSADGTETSVTINITGTNDAAILSSDTEELVESNAVLSTGGTLTISDVDSAETFVAQTDTAGTYGKFSVGTDGTWTYSTAPSAHDEFVDGATYTDTFSVFSADGTETSVTINITGTNDAAILSSDTEELVESNAVLSTGGTLTISDVDSAETFVAQTDTAGTYGKFSVGTDGTWTYSTAPSAHDEFVDGATYTDTFSVFSADGTETSVTINITGTNDAAILSSDTEELVESNAVLSTGGTLTISDVDSAETFVAQTDTAGTYGKFSVGTDGTWTYSTAPSAHDEFVDGATYTDTFSVFSADGTETSVTINITGTNDAAILSSDTEELVESNAVLSTGGTLTISDVDSAETFVAQTDTAGTYGKFSVGTDGTWTYSTAPSAHDEFVDGATYTDTFSVFSADGTETSVTINITGTNDAAILSSDTEELVESNAVLSTGGTLTISDVDSAETFVAQTDTAGTYGKFSVGTDGTWTYSTAPSAHDEFVDGATYTDTFSVFSADGTETSVTINITGTNDAAILSSDTEELVESNAVLSTGGTLTISDVDSAETFVAQTDTAGTYGKFSVGTDGTWTYSTAPSAHDEFVDGATYTDTFSVFSADGTETSVTINITGTNDAAILSSDTEELVESNAVLSTGGTLTISDVDSAETFVAQTDTAGTYGKFSVGTDGTWTYSTAPSAHDEFVDGATYTDTFSVFSADGTETSVTINITGTNDAAILSSDTEELVESNAVLSTGGTLTISDVDSAETFVAQTDTAGTYGKFSVGTDGTWTYSTAPSAHDEFVDGATYTDTFSVFSADGTETSVTINITGTNDAAILSSDTEELVESNAVLSTGGTLTISDVDSAETFVAQTDTAGTYGKFSVGTDGTWTYSTAPSAHDEFVDGATYTDTFSVFSADGTETSVTINITGTNDAAILSSDTEELVESNAVLSTGGTLTISDVDSAETFVAQTDTAGTYGKFSVGTDGTWTYSTAPSAHDEFVDGATYTDTFSVFSADGTETSVTINITGTNDAAILSSDTEELVESNAVLSTGGTLTISDVDSAETFVAQTDTAGTYGKFSVGTDGTWTYSTAPSAHDEFVDGATYTDTFSVFSADGTETSVTINITGTNDAAILSSDTEELVESNAVLSTGGTLTISDVDSAETFVAQTDTAGTYGKFSVGTDGTWTYSTAPSAHDEFVDGATYTDTFSVFSADGTETSVTINITGTNDAAILSSDTEELVESNAVLSTGGTLTISDVDSAETFVAQTDTAGTYGKFSVGTDGTWTYSTAPSAHDEFVDGATYTDTFSVFSADGTETSVTINITGTNDAAILSSDTEELVESNAVLSTGGTLTISDVDSAETFVAQTDTAGTYGKFSVGTDGTWTYSTAPSAHDEFVDGATYTDTFSVFSADGTETSVTINITGTNDAAILSSDTEELVESNAVLSTGGTLTISDVDSAETFVAQTDTAGTYGKFSVGTDGTWTYSTAPSAHDEFVDGATYTDTFSVFSADGTETSVTINITGTNDAAILSSDTEELVESNAVLSTGGTLTISDVDSAETFVAQTDTAGTYGKFSVGTDGTWTYSTAPSAHDEFVDGATYTDTFSVFSADGTETSVTINITGTNDAALLNAAATPVGAAVLEDAAAPSGAVGTLVSSLVDLPGGGGLDNVSDVDSGAVTGIAITGADAANGTWYFSTDGSGWTALGAVSAGSARLLAADSDNRVYFKPNADYDGQADLTFRAWDQTSGSDGGVADTTTNGGTTAYSTATDTATFDVTPANDAPVGVNDSSASAGATAATEKGGTANGSGGNNGTGNVITNDTDVDSGGLTVTAIRTGGTEGAGTAGSLGVGLVGAHGTLTIAAGGGYTYIVNESDAAVQALNSGGSITDSFNYTITDGSLTDTAVLTVSINGANDAPVNTVPASVVENQSGNNRHELFTLSVTDPDHSVLTVSLSLGTSSTQPQLGTLTLSTTAGLSFSAGANGTTAMTFSGTAAAINAAMTNIDWATESAANNSTRTLTMTTTDGGLLSDTDTVSLVKGNGTTFFAPAGVSGEPINLGLAAVAVAEGALVAVAVQGLPQGWLLNGGAQLADGSWSVATTDLGSLTVSTPSTFTGANALQMQLSWTNADGTAGGALVTNNVEAFSAGNPIFAVSTDDHLTGSSGADTFVFAAPISNDVIHSFDVAADTIDLIGFGPTSFAELAIANDANGNAVITLASGSTILVEEVDASALGEANFMFDVEPTTVNASTMTIGDGAILPLGGTVENSGTIELASTGNSTNLEILFRGANLTGGGHVVMSDSDQNAIWGGSADTVLVNVDNIISGAGQLGAEQLTFVNESSVVADGTYALVVDTGAYAVSNSGVMEATGSGGLLVMSDILNDGTLWANGGNVTVLGAVSGTGHAEISGSATMEFSGASTNDTSFAADAAGVLVLDDSDHYSGAVSGFDGNDSLRLSDVLADGASLSYTANADDTGGVLTASDGVTTANVSLVGQYVQAGFTLTSLAGVTGSVITYNPDQH